MEKISKEQRSKIMQAIKSTDTKDEIRLRNALWHEGLRYRKNNKTVFGKPDLTFKKIKIAIFVDSEFFHGKNWEKEKLRFKSNQEFWHKKIERNMQRDKEVNEYLASKGWTVLRFWSKEVQKNLDEVVAVIQNAIEEAKSSTSNKL